jgi:hypothetical protein
MQKTIQGPSPEQRAAALSVRLEAARRIHETIKHQGIDSLIPMELLPKINKWAKARGLSVEVAIVRLIEHGLAR